MWSAIILTFPILLTVNCLPYNEQYVPPDPRNGVNSTGPVVYPITYNSTQRKLTSNEDDKSTTEENPINDYYTRRNSKNCDRGINYIDVHTKIDGDVNTDRKENPLTKDEVSTGYQIHENVDEISNPTESNGSVLDKSGTNKKCDTTDTANADDTDVNGRRKGGSNDKADLNAHDTDVNRRRKDGSDGKADLNAHDTDVNGHRKDGSDGKADLNAHDTDVNGRRKGGRDGKADLTAIQADIVEKLAFKEKYWSEYVPTWFIKKYY